MIRRLLVALLAAAGSAEAVASAELVALPTRDGVVQRYALVKNGSAPPRAIAVLFTGGAGAIDLARRMGPDGARFEGGGNFLVRMRDAIAGDDIVDAIVDAPSDQLPSGMSDAFRAGAAHATDIGAVVADLKRRFEGAGVYLIGTSRGTVSAAHVGARLGDAIRGVALTSTVTSGNRAGPGLAGFDFASVRAPLLFIHHRDDACPVSGYPGAERAARGHVLVSVAGGDPPRSGPCDPFAPHGFLGREQAVVEALRAFMLGREIPREIP